MYISGRARTVSNSSQGSESFQDEQNPCHHAVSTEHIPHMRYEEHILKQAQVQ